MASLQEIKKELSYRIRVPIVRMLSQLNLRIVRNSNHLELIGLRDKYFSIIKWTSANEISNPKLLRFIVFSIANYPQYSQLQQDLLAEYIASLTKKQDRFFVEFGASDGVTYSNSYLLERAFGWRGILAEPGKNWHECLSKNRTAILSKDCVWRITGEVIKFAEAKNGEYSTIRDFVSKDSHSLERQDSKIYEVQTVSLGDLLSRHEAPRHINYMSIDTEGSEYEILRTFDIGKYKIDFITIEHNFTENRERIHEFMTENGYIRILEKMSAWDDWYVTTEIFHLMDLHNSSDL
jgi:FkbM family methyltransferase